MIPEDIRILAVLDWLENDLLLNILSFEPASSDASFRRYFRVKTDSSQFIVMDAPPDKEDTGSFIKVAELMEQAQVNVPTIFHKNLTDGFLLLEDFGAYSFLDRLTETSADTLYQSAFDSLIKLQTRVQFQNANLPRYNEQLLQREMNLFDEWFLGQSLDVESPEEILVPAHELLISSALEQPVVCVHRDFHSRNLMVLDNNSPGVLDFQDAVIGPITYDLVSLLRDCYIAWSDEQIDNWVARYHQQLLQTGLVKCELTQFKRWFDLMGMQRHLKAIGIFSRLNLRDGKSGYLKDIPRTLNYVVAQARNYPELSDFHEFLDKQILPIYSIAA